MLEQAKRMLSGLAGKSVLAAVSGGMDSMCLLHLLHTWGRQQGIAVTAAHFNHQLRGTASDGDEAFVRSWCADNGVPFVCGREDVRGLAEREKLSMEEAARKARYAFLRQAAGERLILTAHHADDNAETMLLNLLRGTGLKGLTGIPQERDGLLRPFRNLPQSELRSYAEEFGVPYVEDETNALEDAARNVLRHRVLPVLRELNPCAVENMARTAMLLAEDEAALSRSAQELLSRCRPMDRGLGIPVEDCLRRDSAVRSRCVLELLARVGGRRKDLSYTHVEAVCGLLQGPPGREVRLPYGLIARQDGKTLWIFRGGKAPEAVPLKMGDTVSFGSWRISLMKNDPGEGCVLELAEPGEKLTVTVWRPDDRMRLPGTRGSRSFKRLCADAGLTPEQRDLLPVLRIGERCAAAAHIGVDMNFAPTAGDGRVFVRFFKETEEKDHDQ